MDAATRSLVRVRAGNLCEYCHIHQDEESFARYQIEHIIAKQHGGLDDEINLALACPHCNCNKGPNLCGFDTLEGKIIPLFHPRLQKWDEHFELQGSFVFGRTVVGRITVRVLKMNHRDRIELRKRLN